ncbi:fatty-acid amide hydrolase 2 [Neodiprion pinetum]|uniref:Fatty-acid amide hydrolase 2 n=1 Tax=Neodiprion lecontei TaxID=441921 RepID=A0A6J0BUR3_NEOLC|nr:fatty-acid amide hydrolase 2 [Neodiprion lecontei]XP_046465044.1 fatty-acid amide hydrolase 2-like [Neodiprion pinetum]XP_046465045.1 fatty-acid amide hydrolase 2-like [Neodiprion pinetum]XP_046587069.1 fatty-acid amide hydrolase 2 [Neodiprion lecontei]
MELVIRLFTFLSNILYHILRPFFWYANRHPGSKISAAKDPILKLSAVAIAEKIRQRELSSEAVISAYIARIREVNPLLNAVVEDRFESAIREAKLCDEKLATGEVTAKQLEAEQPLYGVPVTVKESCAVKGLSHTGFSLARSGVKANYDSEPVVRLKIAGAIPLCVTNTPELCLGFETQNNVFGTTNNPYDTRRTAGGSSGGEAALLTSAASVIGIGSDIAGSIRLPAHLNGVFGHKPTPGAISIEGHFPYVDDAEFCRYLVIGPMTRYAEDLALAVRVMADRNCTAALRLDSPVDVKSVKVRYMEEVEASFGLVPVHEDVKRTIKQAAEYLRVAGADVEKVNIGQLKDSLELGLVLFFGMHKMPQILLNPDDPKHESNTLSEAGKAIFGLSRHTKSAIFFKFMKDVKVLVPRSRRPSFRMEAQKLQRTFMDLLGDDGVFLFPTFVTSAPFHGQLSLQLAGTLYCIICNVLGLPSTHVPMGLDSEGLPVGLQVIAAPMQDRLCLAVAKELEKGFGGWIPPSVVTA